MALKEKYQDEVEFIIADVDDPQGAALASEYRVDTIPTFRFINKGGEVVDSFTGVTNEKVLEKYIDKMIK